MQSVLSYVMAVVGAAGIVVVAMHLLGDWLYWKKCEKWCAKRGLKCVMVETKDGDYGYVAHDPELVRWFQIPSDFGELDEGKCVGARLVKFDWNGTDKVAVEKDGSTIPLDFVEKDKDGKKTTEEGK